MEHMQVAFDESDSVTGKCAGQAQKWLRQSNSMLKAGADMFPGDEVSERFPLDTPSTLAIYP